MKLKTVVNQLRAVLPKYSSKYNTAKSITSLSSSGSTVTANCTAHGYSVGDYVLIKGAKVPYAISSLTRVGTQATVITSAVNQVVYEKDGTVEITGSSQSDYNGTKTLILPKKIKISSLTKVGNTVTAVTEEEHGFVVNSNFKINVWGAKQAIYNQDKIVVASVPSTTSFTYTIYGNTTSPAIAHPQIYCQAVYNDYTFFFEVENSPVTPATGTMYQLINWNGGYNGFYQIATKTDNSFTYTMNIASANSPAQGTITANTMRIDACISLEKAKEIYTAQSSSSKYWIFVIPNQEIASRNARETSDAQNVMKSSSNYHQTIIYNFDVLLFIPSTSSLGSGDIYDLAQTEKVYILKSLLGSFLDSLFFEGTLTAITYLGSQPVDLEDAYYVHSFGFQTVGYLEENDIVDENDVYAFRQIQERYIDEDEEDTGLDSIVNLTN